MTTAPGNDPVVELIGRAVAGENEPGLDDLAMAARVRAALVAAGWGDLKGLASRLTGRAETYDSVADRWTAEDRDQALIDSGTAAGYRGAAEMAAKTAATKAVESSESKAVKTIIEVVDQWQNGALVNKGGYDGIVWVEPLWPLPRGVEKIREALAVLQSKPGAGDA